MNLIKVVEQAFANEKVASYPKFKAGDTITVTYRIKEGDKERLQKFRGTVIQLRGASAATRTFTVRKVASKVITFVTDAGGSASSIFFAYSIAPVDASISTALLQLSPRSGWPFSVSVGTLSLDAVTTKVPHKSITTATKKAIIFVFIRTFSFHIFLQIHMQKAPAVCRCFFIILQKTYKPLYSRRPRRVREYFS